MRASRLGYHWVERLNAFVRMCDAVGGTTHIELAPPDSKALRGLGGKYYRRFWEGDLDITTMIPILNTEVVEVPQVFYVDDDGEYIRPAPWTKQKGVKMKVDE